MSVSVTWKGPDFFSSLGLLVRGEELEFLTNARLKSFRGGDFYGKI